TVRLVASYTDVNTDSKLAYLEIRVEDGTCVCPAKVNSSPETWLNFMCHNLGATYDVISSSQIAIRAHHGDWYRFGATAVSMENTPYHDSNNNWDDAYYSNGDWANDGTPPCPAGWRIPTKIECEGVRDNNIWLVASGWSGFDAVKQVGNYLYLPAAGRRLFDNDGVLALRGVHGSYWTSSGYSATNSWYMSFNDNTPAVDATPNRRYGYSVRCVSAE
ncbi:MAG: hypothetical protein LBP72_10955, partial [Dysgonamonadaceae bacterium]|nr:hypothetical protein [Dysgonamonadaceae bacterium]